MLNAVRVVAAVMLAVSILHAEFYDLSGGRIDSLGLGAPGIYFTRTEDVGVVLGGAGPVLPHLEAWSISSRFHALAGASSAANDDPDAATLNPGALGYSHAWRVRGFHGPPIKLLLPWAAGESWAGSVAISDFPRRTMRTVLGLGAWYFSPGGYHVFNSRGEWLGRSNAWDASGSLSCGVRLAASVGVGMAVRVVHSHLMDGWVFTRMPELGTSGGAGTTVALDLGVLTVPARYVSAGLSITNLSPGLTYCRGYDPSPLPTTVRAGVNLVPPMPGFIRFTLPIQVTKPVYARVRSGGGHGHWCGVLPAALASAGRTQWRIADFSNTQLAVGSEVAFWEVLSLRVGYFEDIANSRGGIVVAGPSGAPQRMGVFDLLFDRRGRPVESVAFCWGVGVGYRDIIRLDFSMDHDLYDFGGTGYAVSCTAQPGELAELARTLRAGVHPVGDEKQ